MVQEFGRQWQRNGQRRSHQDLESRPARQYRRRFRGIAAEGSITARVYKLATGRIDSLKEPIPSPTIRFEAATQLPSATFNPDMVYTLKRRGG